MHIHSRSKRSVIVAAATAAALTIGLAGCSSPAAPAPASEEKNDTPLDLWVRVAPSSPEEATAVAVAEAFTEETGIEVNVTALLDDFDTKMQQAAAQKDLPDLVINDLGTMGNLVSQGLVRPVDRSALGGADAIDDISWDAARAVDGEYYGVPYSRQSNALLIRSDWLETLELSAPTTWDELTEVAEAFATQDPDGNGAADTAGLAIPGTNKSAYVTGQFAPFLWQSGGDFFTLEDETFTTTVGSKKAVAAAKEFQSLFCTDGLVVPGASTMDTQTANQVFETGKAGMYITGPYTLSRFDGSLGKDKYEVVPAPAGPAGVGTLAGGENLYLMAGSPNESGQDEFAEFAISESAQTLALGVTTGGGSIVRLPVNTAVDAGEERSDDRWNVFAEEFAAAGHYWPAVPNWTPFRQATADALNTLVSTCTASPADAMAALATTFDAELAKQQED